VEFGEFSEYFGNDCGWAHLLQVGGADIEFLLHVTWKAKLESLASFSG
jgi:hypothetical protein